jgi:hypothetical protein
VPDQRKTHCLDRVRSVMTMFVKERIQHTSTRGVKAQARRVCRITLICSLVLAVAFATQAYQSSLDKRVNAASEVFKVPVGISKRLWQQRIPPNTYSWDEWVGPSGTGAFIVSRKEMSLGTGTCVFSRGGCDRIGLPRQRPLTFMISCTREIISAKLKGNLCWSW